MKVLLDTHVLLWSATDPDRLTSTTKEVLEDGENDVFVSAVVGWEVAIKQSIGKLDLPRPAELWLPEVIRRSGFALADIGMDAALAVRSLPWHHKDPFDRLLIAHARVMGATIVTHDAAFAAYEVPLLSA